MARANLDARTIEGDTPWLEAMLNGWGRMAAVLEDQGADVEATRPGLESPLNFETADESMIYCRRRKARHTED